MIIITFDKTLCSSLLHFSIYFLFIILAFHSAYTYTHNQRRDEPAKPNKKELEQQKLDELNKLFRPVAISQKIEKGSYAHCVIVQYLCYMHWSNSFSIGSYDCRVLLVAQASIPSRWCARSLKQASVRRATSASFRTISPSPERPRSAPSTRTRRRTKKVAPLLLHLSFCNYLQFEYTFTST